MIGEVVLAGLLLAGCAKCPTREECFAKEARCLSSYCSSNAAVAEAALLDCAAYAHRCEQAGIEGIPYNEVFARLYGRLYLVARYLGHSEVAEQYLEKYAHYHAFASTQARQTGRVHGEMEALIRRKFDQGLEVAWRKP
jgi:hypothetical protein